MPDYRASWYSQLPAFGWFDREDRPGSNALGVPDWQQGIALPYRRTLGQWFNVTPPGGRIPYPMQQTDTGPAPWTGRGVDISAAAAHQMGYTPQSFPTNASFRIEPRDEPRALGSPAGLPVDAGDLPDNAVDTGVYAGATPGGRRNMPTNSLMDLMGGNLQPSDALGQPTGWGNALASRSNSLIGLGLGLLQPYNPWAGTNAYSNALRGYMTGAQADQSSAQDAWRRQMTERQFAESNMSDFAKMQRDIARFAGTPQAEDVKKFYAAKLGETPQLVTVEDPKSPGDKLSLLFNPRAPTGQQFSDLQGRPFNVSAATAATATPTGGGGVGYLGGGPFNTGTQPAAAPTAAAPSTSQPGAPPIPAWLENMPASKDKREMIKQAGIEAAKEQIKIQTQQASQEPFAKQSAQNVMRAIDRATELANNPGGLLPTTGIIGNAIKSYYQPGTDLEKTLNTVAAGASLDKLQAMKAASPSGASGLGSVTEQEHTLLQNSIAALAQSQSKGQFLENLQHVRSVYSWILNRTDPRQPPPEPPTPQYAGRTGGAGIPQGAGDPLAQARAAIGAGADRNAVIRRLQQNGIDPSGL